MALQNNYCEDYAKTIRNLLKSDCFVEYFKTIDSTNTYAKSIAGKYSNSPVLIVADSQSGGRGRLGRSFYSPSGTGLYMSLLIKPSDPADIVCMTTAASVCVCEALESMCDVCPEIKWVNDIYIYNKKVCGILCEAVTNPKTSQIDSVVIGIGINLTTENFPNDIANIATSLNTQIDRNQLCAVIAEKLIRICNNLSDRSFIDYYKAHSLVLNKEIAYTENGETKTATAIDIDSNGGLVIKTKDDIKTLSTGEISVKLNNV